MVAVLVIILHWVFTVFNVTVDLLPRLLLPLAGPTPDTFDDEDIEKLPIDLQYLDETKKIEEDTDIRKLLLESLLQVSLRKPVSGIQIA